MSLFILEFVDTPICSFEKLLFLLDAFPCTT